MIASEIQHKNCKEKHDGSSLLIRNVANKALRHRIYFLAISLYMITLKTLIFHEGPKYNFNLFNATGIFPYPLKTLENQRFSNVSMGYRKKTSGMKWV